MSLLQKASIVTTPTAYGVGVLNSIKPAYALGENIVTNGTFDTDSDWTKGTGWTISGGKANCDGTQTGTSNLYQNMSNLSNKSVKVEYTVSNYSAGHLDLSFFGTGLPASETRANANGNYIWYVNIPTGHNGNVGFSANSSFVGSVDNFSVKVETEADFDFTRTSSATRVNPNYLIETVSINSANLVQNGNFSELSSEKITNGNFETDSDWTKGAGWSISNGKASKTGSASDSLYQSGTFLQNKTYKLSFSLTNTTQGNLIGQLFGGGGSNEFFNTTSIANGNYTFYVQASINRTTFGFYASGSFDGSIDNVSVKQVDPNDNWNLVGDFEINENKAFINNASQYSQLTQQLGVNFLTSGNKYKVTIDIPVMSISGVFALRYTGGAIIPILSSEIIDGKYTRTFVMPSNGNFWLQTTGAYSGLNVQVDKVSLIEIQENGVPRLDYTNGTASILLEPQRTNLITYSQDFSQWTPDTNASITSNSIISPDGTQNADKLIAGSSVARQSIKFNLNTTGNISAYVFAKKGEYTVIQLTDALLGSAFANFDLQSGLVGSTNTFAANIENYGNDWFKCSITYNSVNSPINSFRISIAQSSTSARLVNFAGNSSDGLYIYGAQLENELFSTSLINTSGSVVTRAAETLNNAGNSDLINSTEGVLYCEIAALADDGTYRILSLSDGTTDERIYIQYTNVSNTIAAVVKNGGVTQANRSFVLSDETQFNKIAFKYKANNFALWINGVQVGTDTNGSTPIGLSELAFDNGAGGNDFYGRCKTVAVFKEALSDTELACLTSTNNREIFLNYYYRMQYVGANTEAIDCAQIKLNV